MRNPTGVFKDPFNPTADELKVWAYGDYYEPVQDFDLVLVNDPIFIIGMIEDKSCRKDKYLLRALYIWFVDEVKMCVMADASCPDSLSSAVESAKRSAREDLRMFAHQCGELLDNPEEYRDFYPRIGWVSGSV